MSLFSTFLNAVVRKEGYRFDDQLHKAFTERTHYVSPRPSAAPQGHAMTFRLYYDVPNGAVDPKSKLDAWKEIAASMEKALGDLGCANVRAAITFGNSK